MAEIRNHTWFFRPQYKLVIPGQAPVSLFKPRQFLKDDFVLETQGGSACAILGSIWHRDDKFERNGEPVGKSLRRTFSWHPVYEVEMLAEENEIVVIAAIIALDKISQTRRRMRN